MKVRMKTHVWGYKSVTLNLSWETCSCTILLGKQKYLLHFFLVSSFFKIQFLRCFETRCHKKQWNLLLFLLEQVCCKFVSIHLHLCSFCSFSDVTAWLFFSLLLEVCLFFFFFFHLSSILRNLFTFSLCLFNFFFFILAILLSLLQPLLQPRFLFVFPILLSLSFVKTSCSLKKKSTSRLLPLFSKQKHKTFF